MNQYAGVSLDALHYLLWTRATGDGRVRIQQAVLADELLLSRQRITQVIADMEEEGRLSRTRERSVYQLTDPADR